MHVMFVLVQIMELHKWHEDVRYNDGEHKMILTLKGGDRRMLSLYWDKAEIKSIGAIRSCN